MIGKKEIALRLSAVGLYPMVFEALCIRHAIVSAGGMATKSAVEDVLMALLPGVIDRGSAHDVMNAIEFYNLSYGQDGFVSDYEPVVGDYRKELLSLEHPVKWYSGDPFADR